MTDNEREQWETMLCRANRTEDAAIIAILDRVEQLEADLAESWKEATNLRLKIIARNLGVIKENERLRAELAAARADLPAKEEADA